MNNFNKKVSTAYSFPCTFRCLKHWNLWKILLKIEINDGIKNSEFKK